ncbi:MAG: uroporphyrinogen-III synthase [Neolewinella sp.]
MPVIFISRNLREESLLRKWAAETGWEVIGRSLISFAPVEFEPLGVEETDWWFFYSPRAVEFAANALVSGKCQHRSDVKLAAMGPGTAQALRGHQGAFEPDFVGEGSPAEVAKAFGKMAEGETVFFPRARQSRLTVQTILQEIITVQDAVCYDNVAVPVAEPVAAEVYVFTSPLNVAAYLGHQALPADARVIALGPSTGTALAQHGVKYEVTEQPGEAWVVALMG